MKKTVWLFLGIALTLVMTFSIQIQSEAQENTKSTAYELNTENVATATYSDEDYDYEMWFKFTAPSKGWFEFEILNPLYTDGDWSSYIYVYNEQGDELDLAGVDSFSERCIAYANCKSGATYYLLVQNFQEYEDGKDYTVELTASKHTHDYQLIGEYVFETYKEMDYRCRGCEYEKTVKINAPKTATLSKTKYTYDSKAKKPGVTVKDTKGNKIDSKYYSLSYSSGRKSVGKYSVTIKFKGKYSGFDSIKKTFTIVPKGTAISSLTAGSKKISVKWKKQTTQTTGYQIQYATKSDFSNKKTITIKNAKTVSKTISKLSAKKKYYIRIRTYKSVKDKNYYSSWSKAKSATTKK